MCAILDANVVPDVFTSDQLTAGKEFFKWINSGIGRLVVGGKLLEELNRTSGRVWARRALNRGLIRRVSESKVKERTEKLQNEGVCRSDDPHVIALAQVSGARLLYTNDSDLQKDFKNKNLVNNPAGKIYSTDVKNNPNKEFRDVHRGLLGRNDLCRVE